MARSAVFDCNVFLQIMLNTRGAAHACWERVTAGDAELFVTQYILNEIRRLPEHRKLKRFGRFTFARVDRFVDELLAVATLAEEPPPLFSFARDPADAHYVNPAIASGALLVVSNDRDLLDLVSDSSSEGKQLRADHPFQVLTPPQFLRLLERS